MRVLVACVSQTGHLAPVLPLAEAFAARGDEVIVASAPEAGPHHRRRFPHLAGVRTRCPRRRGRVLGPYRAPASRGTWSEPRRRCRLPVPAPSVLPMAAAPALPMTFADPSRALVYVTLGTLQNTDRGLFRLILAALADEPVNVLVTVRRENDPALLEPIPAKARVERFIPRPRCCRTARRSFHHAGAGTMFGFSATDPRRSRCPRANTRHRKGNRAGLQPAAAASSCVSLGSTHRQGTGAHRRQCGERQSQSRVAVDEIRRRKCTRVA